MEQWLPDSKYQYQGILPFHVEGVPQMMSSPNPKNEGTLCKVCNKLIKEHTREEFNKCISKDIMGGEDLV